MSQMQGSTPNGSASPDSAARPMVELRNVSKRFGSFMAVENVSLQIRQGEFLTLLGPSGCGKTTMLRMISGFETPTEGAVLLDGQDVTYVPPYRRDVNQVFQSYALFPHLSVFENVCFGLKMKGIPRAAMEDRAMRMIEMVSLKGFEHRKPAQLSGGQRQRVALARAIVNEPKVLLLDEPLAALDAKLREQMQVELKRLQKRLGITFIFVTHDQEEALTMSDRIAVINLGRIEQIGTCNEIYHQPRTTFVANFIGEANLLDAEVLARNGSTVRLRIEGDFELTATQANLSPDAKKAIVSIRPEKIYIQKTPPAGDNVFEAMVAEELFKGATDELVLQTASGLQLTAVVANESSSQEAFHEGDRVYCQLHPDDIVIVQ
jgi:spermidine/putrescine transport system ATP-binding protein